MKADYGLDAPAVVRNLALGGVAAAIVAVLAQVLPAVLPMTQSDRNTMSVWFVLTAVAVLDVGCGRGLLLVAAAKRLPEGAGGRSRSLERP